MPSAAVPRTAWWARTTQNFLIGIENIARKRNDSQYCYYFFFLLSHPLLLKKPFPRFLYSTRLLLYGRNGDYSSRV